MPLDATTGAVWAALALVLARTLTEVLRERNGRGAAGFQRTLDDIRRDVRRILEMHEPDSSGTQSWKGVPEIRRLLEQEVIPTLYRLERNLLDGRP
ncbi:MAG: hypothetical protein D6760_03195 [Deltaproteobacteria bacterium]|nr:MAG: hypothetical protein D6760_03195 [Deltaproteobacteria bacterium]